jgi:hypothetical protein
MALVVILSNNLLVIPTLVMPFAMTKPLATWSMASTYWTQQILALNTRATSLKLELEKLSK